MSAPNLSLKRLRFMTRGNRAVIRIEYDQPYKVFIVNDEITGLTTKSKELQIAIKQLHEQLRNHRPEMGEE